VSRRGWFPRRLARPSASRLAHSSSACRLVLVTASEALVTGRNRKSDSENEPRQMSWLVFCNSPLLAHIPQRRGGARVWIDGQSLRCRGRGGGGEVVVEEQRERAKINRDVVDGCFKLRSLP